MWVVHCVCVAVRRALVQRSARHPSRRLLEQRPQRAALQVRGRVDEGVGAAQVEQSRQHVDQLDGHLP